jgi:hypothetical protein
VPETTALSQPSTPPRPIGEELPSPPASRLGRPRWLDLRLVVGVLLVLGSVLVGTRVVAGADDSTPVLAVTRDLQPGLRLDDSDVATRRVSLDDGLEHYVAAGSPIDGYVVTRRVSEGELLPREAIAPSRDIADADDLRWVTLAVPSEERPSGLSEGDLVDVWVAPLDSAEAGSTAERLAEAVPVEATASRSGGLGGSNESTVTLALTGKGQASPLDELVAVLVAAARDSRVYLVAHPGAGPAAVGGLGD